MAAPSFFIPLLLAVPLAAQAPRLDVRVAVVSSSTLVEDLLARPALKARFGTQLGSAPSVRAATAPELSVGATVPLSPRVRLQGLVGWQPTTLQATDDSGTRDVQDMSVLHALLEAEFGVRGPLIVAAAVGMLGYRSAGEGLFAGGSDPAPLLRVGAGGHWALAGQAVSVRAIGDVHRFGTALLRSAGGAGGGVIRWGLQLGIVPGGAR